MVNFTSVPESPCSLLGRTDEYLSLKGLSELPQHKARAAIQYRITDFRIRRVFEHLIEQTYCRNQLKIRK